MILDTMIRYIVEVGYLLLNTSDREITSHAAATTTVTVTVTGLDGDSQISTDILR